MRVILSEADWNNGFLFLPTDGGNTLVVNAVDENFMSGEGLTSVGMVLAELAYRDGTRRRCTNVIGMSDGICSVGTDNPDLAGHELTPANMASCWLDVDDREE